MQKSDGLKIAHITDLHIGKHDDKVWERLTECLHDVDADFYVFSGDITDGNDWSHYRLFLDWLRTSTSTHASKNAHGLNLGNDISSRVFMVPGNHDYYQQLIPKQGKKGSSDFFTIFPDERLPQWKVFTRDDAPAIFVVGLDSSKESTIANGEVEKTDLELIRKWSDQGRHGCLVKKGDHLGIPGLSDSKKAAELFRSAYKILVIHHYVFMPRARGREPLMVLDNAHEVLAQVAIDDFDMVLSGHDHRNIFDDPKYDHLLDERALRRFARMYCVRQVGVRCPPVYEVDQKGRLLKRNCRIALDYLRSVPEKLVDKFGTKIFRLGNLTIVQKLIKRGTRDFLSVDLSAGQLKSAVKKIAGIVEDEISSALSRRSMVNALAPSATKEGEEIRGFFVYEFGKGRVVTVKPFYETSGGVFRQDEEATQEYSVGRPLDLFKTKAYRVLKDMGVIGGGEDH